MELILTWLWQGSALALGVAPASFSKSFLNEESVSR